MRVCQFHHSGTDQWNHIRHDAVVNSFRGWLWFLYSNTLM